MKKGLVHIYIGDGQGKTTAAVGLAARAAGSGRKVLFAQFLKGRGTGEIAALETLGVSVIRSKEDPGFIWKMDDEQKEAYRAEQSRLFDETMEAVSDDAELDLLALDEALDVIGLGLIDESRIIDAIEQKPDRLEIVLTGRAATDGILATADYVTEMKKVRHPFDRGVAAREGVEY